MVVIFMNTYVGLTPSGEPMKRKPKWKRSDKTWELPNGSNLELAQFSINMNKGFARLQAEYETCLSGYHGEIWQSSPSQYKVVFTAHKVAHRFARALGLTTTCTEGDEPIFTFSEKHLYAAVEHIKIPSSPGTRVKLANSFGKRK